MKKFIILALLLIIPFNAYADSNDISEVKRKDIKKLLELMDTKNMSEQIVALYVNDYTAVLKSSTEDIPDSYYKIISEEALSTINENLDTFLDMAVPIYAKNFTYRDIKGLINFYESPLGRKFVERQPIILQEATVVALQWAKQLEPLLSKRVLQRIHEEESKTK